MPILEYLIRPQQKVGNGVYGGGWERPKNVFMAARTFKRQWDKKKAAAANGKPSTSFQALLTADNLIMIISTFVISRLVCLNAYL